MDAEQPRGPVVVIPPFKKRRKPGDSGRRAGTPNKVSSILKDMVIQALDVAGGVDYLVMLAYSDPKTFCGLVGRVIPLQITGVTGGPPIVIERRVTRLSMAPGSADAELVRKAYVSRFGEDEGDGES